jgi:hypothetical protein
MRRRTNAFASLVALLCPLASATLSGAQPAPPGPTPAPPASAAPAEDGQWTMPAKNYASTR